MILNYLSPDRVYKRLSSNLTELSNYRRFKKIILELKDAGKLDALGISVDINSNMYIGIDLNPELLMYSETSQESVELKLISEKMNKYNDFLTKEGILDAIKVDYERIQNPDYYGYVLQISFNFIKYRRSDLIYDISYFTIITSGLIAGIVSIM
jgi:hypothetical protein